MREPAAIGLPPDFRFGASTAAYQIEGAVTEGGRGRSVWDDFCDEGGRITDGSSGAVACDSYHRYSEDVDLLARLGVDTYRFSFAWPRIQPDGTGRANESGVDFYDRLIDRLCAAGIAPAATIFHWDTPTALQARGGWENRETTERFAAYTEILADRFADRVEMWMPVNEPGVVTLLGHGSGLHAPGRQLGLGALQVAHHLLLAHGRAVEVLRGVGASAVGCANNHSLIWPASDAAEDREAADLYDVVANRTFAEPMLLGSYPDGVADRLAGPVAEDLTIIGAPLDFYGVNSYFPLRVGALTKAAAGPSAGPGREPLPPALPFAMLPIEGYERTDLGWPVVPDAFRDVLVGLHTDYGDRLPPVYVTENGCSYAVGPDESGRVEDTARVAFLDQHLRALAQARDLGADVRGYFAWSLLDNFEWAEGYTQRFGLVWVDFESLQRTAKDSFQWYADVIRTAREQGEDG